MKNVSILLALSVSVVLKHGGIYIGMLDKAFIMKKMDFLLTELDLF